MTILLRKFFLPVFDTMLYEDTFDGMKLAGIIIICFGFLVVLFPENWPDALHRLIRYETIIYIQCWPKETLLVLFYEAKVPILDGYSII